jgi:hypothetical protein
LRQHDYSISDRLRIGRRQYKSEETAKKRRKMANHSDTFFARCISSLQHDEAVPRQGGSTDKATVSSAGILVGTAIKKQNRLP